MEARDNGLLTEAKVPVARGRSARTTLLTASIVGTVRLLFFGYVPTETVAASKPNIVFVLTDDQAVRVRPGQYGMDENRLFMLFSGPLRTRTDSHPRTENHGVHDSNPVGDAAWRRRNYGDSSANPETGTLIYTIPTPPTAQYPAMVCKRGGGYSS
jgi:hypothetical protein